MDELAWLFKGHEHEIAEINEIAEQARRRLADDEQRQLRRIQVEATADAVEKEWRAAARAAAIAEAERRIDAREAA
ncbi:hypothetical protein SK069_09730 [Patulibacter brassicae]|uniref:ATPase n=1 Tax=Patulibacter brassicae TaxID=1705717 RepID=A0ABU4VJ67_9ACTN|nr:hypothetical protein [Patulibacter brassicae]MDX8151872.1 hypothetical protein [Patulibacter brassicae]